MTDGAELILSKTSLSIWLDCRYKWFLSYVLRRGGYPSIDMAVGTAVHAGVEAHWNGVVEGNGPHGVLEQAWVTETREMPLAYLLGFDVEAERLAAHRMLDVYLAKIAPTFTPTMVERDFLIRVDGTLVSGRLDAADDDVHDTKTTSTPSKVDPTRHRLGMTLYAWGYRALTGSLPGRLLLDVVARNGRTKIVEVEPDYAGTVEVVSYVSNGIRAGSFEPTGAATGECARCPYAPVCRYAR